MEIAAINLYTSEGGHGARRFGFRAINATARKIGMGMKTTERDRVDLTAMFAIIESAYRKLPGYKTPGRTALKRGIPPGSGRIAGGERALRNAARRRAARRNSPS